MIYEIMKSYPADRTLSRTLGLYISGVVGLFAQHKLSNPTSKLRILFAALVPVMFILFILLMETRHGQS